MYMYIYIYIYIYSTEANCLDHATDWLDTHTRERRSVDRMCDRTMGVSAFYHPLSDESSSSQDEFFAVRYFRHKGYMHRKYDAVSSAKQEMMNACPGPRLTTFLNGSVFFPYTEREEVYRRLAYDIQTETPSYWNQIAYDTPGEGCRLAVDVDSTRIIPHSEIVAMAELLWRTLGEYYENFTVRPIPVLVSVCGPRLKKGVESTGVHIICHVQVSIEEAQQILTGFKLRLFKDTSVCMDGIEIDTSIYKERSRAVSLRFVYSNKIENCVICENITERRLACRGCAGKGVALSNFTYTPSFAVSPTTGKVCATTFREYHSDFGVLVASHSLWSTESERREDYRRPEGDAVYTTASSIRSVPMTSEYPRSSDRRVLVDRAAKNQRKCTQVEGPVVGVLEEFIRSISDDGITKHWKYITVRLVRIVSARIAHVYVDGIGSTHCHYAQKSHGSNRIWFKLHVSGDLVLQCFSKKKEYSCQTADRIKFNVPMSVSKRVFDVPMLVSTMSVTDTNHITPRSFNQRKRGSAPVTGPRIDIFRPDLKRMRQLVQLSISGEKRVGS